jgi:hypothetical protein
MNPTCVCGRGWDHCRICGGRSIYRLKTESMIAGVDMWQCKKCMKATSYLSTCTAVPNRESKDFVSREKAIRDLAKLPLEERLHIMIDKGATVEEVAAEIEASGVKAIIEEPKPELVIQKVDSDSVPKPEEQPNAFSLDDLFKPKEHKDE